MKKYIKPVLFISLVLGLFWGVKTITNLNAMARIGVGYMTKIACSEIFVANRFEAEVLANDFHGIDPILENVKLDIDASEGTVSGSLYGLGKSKAYHRSGLGCALSPSGRPDTAGIYSQASSELPDLPTEIDANVQSAVDAFFKDAKPNDNAVNRSVLVLQNGVVVGEGYGEGFSRDTPQQSWSMAKSVTQALFGIASAQGLVSIDETNLFPEWEEDERANISVNDLLHMASGLYFLEDYADPTSSVTQMLFRSRDMGARAAQEPLAHPPGIHWDYSSGTTNILSKLLRQRLEADGQDYHAFPAAQLFNKIGMRKATFETDASGTFIGSSYLYATARDWARLGELYRNDGVWGNVPVLPKGWVDYAREPALETTPYYGAQWWLNQDQMRLPDMPKDIFFMGGHDGQYVIVAPSKNAVIVRLGLNRPPASFETDILPLIQNLYNALD